MIGFDIKVLAQDLLAERVLLSGERETIVKRMVEMAVEVVNHPGSMDEILFPVCNIIANEYEVLLPEEIVLSYAKFIRKEMKRHGWDSRLKLKIEFMRVHQAFHRANILMDLDATLLAYKPAVVSEISEEQESINDIICETPSLELLNGYIRTIERQPKRRAPVLSDRLGKSVRGPKD